MKNYFSLSATIVLLATAAPTTAATWAFYRVGHGQNVGNYCSLFVDSQGWWAVAHHDTGNNLLKYSRLNPNGGSYSMETIGPGGWGNCVAFDPTGNGVISYVNGVKLCVAIKIDTAWTIKTIENKEINPGDTSLVYDGAGRACVSYFKTGRNNRGLWFANENGQTWSKLRVDPNAHAVYNQMDVDPDGNPVIAYSADANADGVVDTLKVARWNGTDWEIEIVGEGGQFATLAHDPVSGNLAVVHWNAAAGQLQFQTRNVAGWTEPEFVDPTATSATGCSLDFRLDGTAHVAFSKPSLNVAKRDAISGLWSVEEVDAAAPGSLRNSLKSDRFLPLVAYKGGISLNFYPTSALLAIQRAP